MAPQLRAELRTEPSAVRAGQPTMLIVTVNDAQAQRVRDLHVVHERPIHLLVLSHDAGRHHAVHQRWGARPWSPPAVRWCWWLHLAPRTRGATAMTMTPGLRMFALTAHVTFSGGWLGAVATFLALRRRMDQPGCNLT